MKLLLKNIAQCLDIPEHTVERWIRQGRIPLQKKGKNCIFSKSVMEKWAASRNLSFSISRENTVKKTNEELISLRTVMNQGGIFYGIKGNDMESVLKYAVDKVPLSPSSTKVELYERILEREFIASTGIGKGVAIPHSRVPITESLEVPLITTCFLESPVDFGAIDDKPVFVLFILLGLSLKQHLHLLSRLSFCLRDDTFVSFLKTFPCSDDLLVRLSEVEGTID